MLMTFPGKAHRRAAALALVLLASVAALGCSIVRPVRTLPTWVRGIYLPMVANKSTEPGLEELATRRIQEEFLADGRLNIAPKGSADLTLVVVIKSFGTDFSPFGTRGRGRNSGGFGSSGGSGYNSSNDRISQFQEWIVESEIKLYDPMVDPYDPKEEPVANLGLIITRFTYPSDPRSANVMIEPDAKIEAMGLLARQVVFQVINGFPQELRGAPEGALTVPQPQGPTQQNIPGNPSGTRRDNRSRFDY